MLASHVLTSGVGVLVTIMITRYLGPERYGDLTLAYAYLGLFNALVEAQLSLTLIREASQVKPPQMSRYLGNGVVLQGVLSVTGTGAAILIVPLLGYPPQIVSLLRFGVLLLLFSPFSLFRLIFLITQEIRLVAVLDTIIQLLTLALSLLVLVLEGDVMMILFLKMTSTAIGGFLYYQYGKRLLDHPLSFRPDFQLWWLLLRRSGPLVFTGVMNAVQIHAARLFIGRYLTRGEGGLYAVALKLMALLTLLPSLYYTSVYPLLTRYYKEDRALFAQLCRFSFKSMIILALPLSLLAIFAGRRLVVLYAGPDFTGAATLFIALVSLLVFQFSGSTIYHIILAIGAQNVLPFISLGRVTLYLTVLAALLLPLKLQAPPLANLSIYLFVFVIYGLWPRTRSYIIMWLLELWRPLLITLLLGLSLQQLIDLAPLAWMAILPLYVTLLFLSGVVRWRDVKWLLRQRRRLIHPS